MRSSAFLEVRLFHLKENIIKLRSKNNRKILFMVKANAYGLGVIPIVKYLTAHNLIDIFGVATSGEADQIIREIPSFNGQIYVFSDFHQKDSYFVSLKDDLRVFWVIHDQSQLELIKMLPGDRIVIKVDTGMNRLGFQFHELNLLISTFKESGINRIHHLMSHFSDSALNIAHQKNLRQISLYKDFLNGFEEAEIAINFHSFANSGAIEQSFNLPDQIIRPGLMLYGPSSSKECSLTMQNISSLKVRPIKIFNIKKGTPIGYGSTPAPEDGVLCLVPLGYGDGLLSYYSGAKLTISSMPARIIGKINMDMTYLLFPSQYAEALKSLEYLEFWNEQASTIENFAKSVKTSCYQVLCALNTRIPRRYIE